MGVAQCDVGLGRYQYHQFTIGRAKDQTRKKQTNKRTNKQILFSLIQKNKRHLREAMLKTFYLNGHTNGFHPKTQNLQLY